MPGLPPGMQMPKDPRILAAIAKMRNQVKIVSPEILSDGRVTFRILAPNAKDVTVGGLNEGMATDPNEDPITAVMSPSAVLTKGANDVWSGTTAKPVAPGAYRYTFDVDGVTVLDSSNTLTSPSNGSVSSLLVIPGDFSEERDVPHGALARVDYSAPEYGPGVQRMMYVYTPPGYEKSTTSYPVLYLLHGGGDAAGSWATVGRANFIMDNLIAEKKALPFIVVMFDGWTPKGPQPMTVDAATDPVNAEFVNDIIPAIEHRYRVKASAHYRALSGLSMGGFQTLTLGMKNIEKFDYLAPMSTGFFTPEQRAAYIAANRPQIDRAIKQLKLFRWGWGTTDMARDIEIQNVDAMRAAGFKNITTLEVSGGHQWVTWRQLFHDEAQLLFR